MRLHAVEAPVLKLAAVAGAALLVGAFAATPRPTHEVRQRLELHVPAPERCNTVYDTAFENGYVTVALPDGKPRTFVFINRGHHWGCEWRATETLIPDGPNRYYYTYDEEKLDCSPDAEESVTTPRSGYALVVGSD